MWRIQPVQHIRPLILPIQTLQPLQPVELHPRLARDAEDEAATLVVEEVDETETRGKRSPQDRGSVGVSVNKDQGRGPQVRTDAQGNIYTSDNGNWRVDGNAYHEAGRGRKPDFGGGISITGRFRREVKDEQIEEDLEASERE